MPQAQDFLLAALLAESRVAAEVTPQMCVVAAVRAVRGLTAQVILAGRFPAGGARIRRGREELVDVADHRLPAAQQHRQCKADQPDPKAHCRHSVEKPAGSINTIRSGGEARFRLLTSGFYP